MRMAWLVDLVRRIVAGAPRCAEKYLPHHGSDEGRFSTGDAELSIACCRGRGKHDQEATLIQSRVW
jgi:hypothetical protein